MYTLPFPCKRNLSVKIFSKLNNFFKFEFNETKRMKEESQLFDLEVDFNNQYKTKLLALNAKIINIEQNYQLKLDENFSNKDELKV